MLPWSPSTNLPPSPPPRAAGHPAHRRAHPCAHPLPPSTVTYLPPHTCGGAPRGRGHTPATSSRHIITRHWDPGAASRGFLSGWHWSPRQKTPSRLLRSWKTFFFLPYMSCRRRPGCRRAPLSGAPRGSIGWGAVTWPRRRDPPPRSRVLLLPPKEGPLDNFHISSKFGDFRQCWEAWLGMPEAHVEVIKSERGSEGRRAGGSRGEESGQGCAGCQRRAWEPRPSHPEKVVCNN